MKTVTGIILMLTILCSIAATAQTLTRKTGGYLITYGTDFQVQSTINGKLVDLILVDIAGLSGAKDGADTAAFWDKLILDTTKYQVITGKVEVQNKQSFLLRSTRIIKFDFSKSSFLKLVEENFGNTDQGKIVHDAVYKRRRTSCHGCDYAANMKHVPCPNDGTSVYCCAGCGIVIKVSR